MNIAQSLKTKNRIAGQIAEAQRKIAQYNQYTSDYPKTQDTLELLKKVETLRSELVTLKTNIAKANVGIANELNAIAEEKAHLSFLTSIRCRVGVSESTIVSHNDRSVTTYSQIDSQKLERDIEFTQNTINALQDEIDAYNAKTLV